MRDKKSEGPKQFNHAHGVAVKKVHSISMLITGEKHIFLGNATEK